MISDPHLPCKTDFLQNEYLVNPKFSIVKNYCCFLMFCFFVCTTPLLAQTEKAYNAQDSLLPNWVKLMYTQNPDPGAVTRAYDEYYGSTPLVKNSHTQSRDHHHKILYHVYLHGRNCPYNYGSI